MTHARDALAAQRRRMPWLAVEKPYEFDGRQEEWEDSPEGYPQTPPYKWWNWHDQYDNTASSQWSSVVDRGLALQGHAVDRKAD